MELSITEVVAPMSVTVDKFYDTATPNDFENVLQYYTVVESTASQKLTLALQLTATDLETVGSLATGKYPSTLSEHFGVISMLGLAETKLQSVINARRTLQKLIIDWELARINERDGVMSSLSRLLLQLENERVVSASGNTIFVEGDFYELIKDRRNVPDRKFTLDTEVFNKAPLTSVISGFKNAANIPLRLDKNKRNDNDLLDLVVSCLDLLAKKITICVESLRSVREFAQSAKELSNATV